MSCAPLFIVQELGMNGEGLHQGQPLLGGHLLGERHPLFRYRHTLHTSMIPAAPKQSRDSQPAAGWETPWR